MKTQAITAARMAAAGVSMADAQWYFQARARGFSKPGEATRASAILLKTCEARH